MDGQKSFKVHKYIKQLEITDPNVPDPDDQNLAFMLGQLDNSGSGNSDEEDSDDTIESNNTEEND